MTDALRMEWTRLRTVRSTYWLLGIGVVLALAAAVIASFVTRTDGIGANIVPAVTGGAGFSALPFLPILLALVAILSVGHDYRHGTILPMLTAMPRRSALVMAKLVVIAVIAVVAIVVSVVSVALNLGAVAVIQGGLPHMSGAIWRDLLGYVIYGIIWSWVGLGLTYIVHAVAASIVIVLVVPLIVEPALQGLSFLHALHFLRPAVKYFPFTAGGRLVARPQQGPGIALMGALGGGLVFFALAVILTAIGWAMFVKRDA